MSDLKQDCDLVFRKIEVAHKLSELKNYRPDFLEKYFLNTKKYPPINYTISKDEVEELGGINLTLSGQLSRNDLTSLEKLMLSMLWKNGDFGKEKHIVEGILNKDGFEKKTSGHVFYQFGKRLNDPKNEPIVDQHIIRAFVFQKKSPEEALKIDYLEKRHFPEIQQYISWVKQHANRVEGENEQILYEIDRILFALGRYIKKTNRKLST